MTAFNNFEEIDQELKRLSLEREIAFEELKGIQHDVKEDLTPPKWLGTIFSFAKKYGLLVLLKKIIK